MWGGWTCPPISSQRQQQRPCRVTSTRREMSPVPVAWLGSFRQMSYIYGSIRMALELLCTPTACLMPYQASAIFLWCSTRSALPSLQIQIQMQLLKGQPHGGRHFRMRPGNTIEQHLLPFISVDEGAAVALLWHEGTSACRMQHMYQWYCAPALATLWCGQTSPGMTTWPLTEYQAL